MVTYYIYIYDKTNIRVYMLTNSRIHTYRVRDLLICVACAAHVFMCNKYVYVCVYIIYINICRRHQCGGGGRAYLMATFIEYTARAKTKYTQPRCTHSVYLIHSNTVVTRDSYVIRTTHIYIHTTISYFSHLPLFYTHSIVIVIVYVAL